MGTSGLKISIPCTLVKNYVCQEKFIEALRGGMSLLTTRSLGKSATRLTFLGGNEIQSSSLGCYVVFKTSFLD